MVEPDATLVERAKSGDREAFTRLYEEHIGPLYGYLRKRLGSREDAEDVTSETFLAAVEQLSSFRGDASWKNWLFTIARRRLGDYWRKRYRMPETALAFVEQYLCDPDDEGTPPEPEDVRKQKLQGVLASLPERERRVLHCRFAEGKSISDTAAELQLSESNVKVIQHRAIAKASRYAANL